MQIFLIIFHVISCLTLILVILLQAGRGSGLSDMFGGGVQHQQKLFGTDTNAFMAKATTFCAVLFIVTSISLGIANSQRGKSLLARNRIGNVLPDAVKEAAKDAAKVAAPAEKAPAAQPKT